MRIDKLLLFELDPVFDSKTGEILLTNTSWNIRMKLGQKQATINGKHVVLDAAPQIIKRINVGISGVFVPVLKVAKSLGYRVRYYAKLGDLDRVFVLIGPHYYVTPLQNFKKQRIVSPLTQKSGDLQATASLITDAVSGTEEPNGYNVGIRIRFNNKGNKPYHASRDFIYLEMWDGHVIDTSHERPGTGDPEAIIQPNHTGGIDASWDSSFSDRIPVKHIIYSDGWHKFVWRVDEPGDGIAELHGRLPYTPQD